jgi:HEAT repeat protein
VDAEHVAAIARCREGLLDAQARREEQRRWAEQLFSYDSAEAKSLIVELLGMADRPDVQRALCQMILERSHRSPGQLDVGLVEPLIDLLGAEAEDLRTTAAEALAGFPGPDVPARLGELVARSDAPMAKRLAAINAMAPNIHRRETVQQLVSLLDTDTPEVVDRVVAVLEPASQETIGVDPARWRQWWSEKSQLGEEAWLADQVRINRGRLRAITQDFDAYRESTRQRGEAITERLREFQRDVFRSLSPGEKEARLTEWLNDPLDEIKSTALGLIKAQIADVGQRPEGEVLAALLNLLRRGSPKMRREVLLIVQNLSDPNVIRDVLAQLEAEDDPATRHAVFKAIGKLDRPEAIPALILEIASPDSSPDCVREAANALGIIAPKAVDQGYVEDAEAALKSRYAVAPPDDVPLRAALLAAMAGVGSASFAPELLDAVQSDDAALLRPAIRGLLAIGDVSKVTRLRDHTAHPDALVRLEAIEAVGQLGQEDADLECLLTRLNPTNESNESAREAAWRAVRTLLSKKPLADQIRASERLRDMPEIEARYLAELADAVSAPNGDAEELLTLRERLATIHLERGSYAEAVPHLREVYRMRQARGSGRAAEAGLRWLDATLKSATQHDVVDVITQLCESFGGEQAHAVVEVVREYLESEELLADPERTRVLLADLQSVSSDCLPPAWGELLQHTADRLGNAEAPPAPEPSP